MTGQSRAAIVTGGCGGLGRASASALASQGYRVLACDVHTGPEPDISTPDRSGEGCVRILTADVSDPEACRAMVAEAVASFERLDVVVLNAGVQHVAPLHLFPLDEWDRLHNTMVRGHFALIQAAWPYLAASGSGRIIAVTSTNSRLAERHKVAYTSAKHALAGLVRAAALEGAAHGITANAVAPGAMLTPLVQHQITSEHQATGAPATQIEARWAARHMTPRMIEPAEVAELIVFLASERSSAITGADLPVDLGKTAF